MNIYMSDLPKNKQIFNEKQSYLSILINGKINSGKSTLVKTIVEKIGDKNRTQVFIVSDMVKDGEILDKTLQSIADDYFTQFFPQKDIEQGLVKNLIAYLHNKRQIQQQ